MTIEIKMPLIRITKYKDGAIYQIRRIGEVWVPGFLAHPGTQYGDDPDVRLGTPDKFESRRVNDD